MLPNLAIRPQCQTLSETLWFYNGGNAIHWRTCYLVGSIVCLVDFYPLDKYLSSAKCYSPFEQLGNAGRTINFGGVVAGGRNMGSLIVLTDMRQCFLKDHIH